MKSGSGRKQQPRAHLGVKQPPDNPAAADSAKREAAKPPPTPPVVPKAPLIYDPKGNLGGPRTHVSVLQAKL